MFSIGDIVVLNSGGPLMTVSKVNLGYVDTIWFDENQKLQHAKFYNECLVKQRKQTKENVIVR